MQFNGVNDCDHSVKTDVLINGGGMAGLTLALLLGQAECDVLVIDHSDLPAFQETDDIPSDLRVVALTRASEQLFESLQVWQEMPLHRLGKMMNIRVWDQTLSGEVAFNAEQAKETNLGTIVEQAVILTVLEKKIKQYPNIKIIKPAHLTSYQVVGNTVVAQTNTGHMIEAKLLVGCDGARSWVRHQANISQRVQSYEQIAIVATIQSEKAHCHTAFQRFNETGALALLPLYDLHRLSIVWSVTEDLGHALMDLSEAAFEQQLTKEIEAVIGNLTLKSKRIFFPLQAQHADSYTALRVALVGDAAHTMHPLAGQGVNLGLLDAMALAQVLIQAKNKGRDIGYPYILQRYERARRLHNQAMIHVMRAFKEGFSTQLPMIQFLRNKGLDWVNQSAALKQFFIQSALGKKWIY